MVKYKNLFVADAYLGQAIRDRNSERSIQGYTNFMNKLPEKEREKILLNPKITKKIDAINKYGL